MNRETGFWRQHPAWLAALPRPVPAELSTPREVAVFEAESYAESCGGTTPAFRFVCEEALGEGYILEQSEPGTVTIRGGSTGLLYGTYEAISDLVCSCSLPAGLQRPACAKRMLDCWDNTDGSVERGYAGRSIWFEGGAFPIIRTGSGRWDGCSRVRGSTCCASTM